MLSAIATLPALVVQSLLAAQQQSLPTQLDVKEPQQEPHKMGKNLFSVPIFFIIFRETIEAAIIVS